MNMTAKSEGARDVASARRISKLVEESGLDVADIQKRTKSGKSTVYSWLAGTRIPSRPKQKELARVLGVSVAQLNGWAA